MFLKDYNKTAIYYKDLEVSFTELLGHVDSYARIIPPHATKTVIFAENRPEWVYAVYASWKKKLTVVPFDVMSSAEEAAYMLKDAAPEVLFCDSTTEKTLRRAVELSGVDAQIYNFDEIADSLPEPEEHTFPDMDPEALALIMYTSGTTGSPKGVMLTFGNLEANITSVSRDVPIYVETSRCLVLLPLHHTLPLVGTILAPFFAGGSVAFSPSRSSEDLKKTLQQHKVTIIVGVPRLFNLMRKGIMDKINKNKVAKLLFKVARIVNSPKFSKKVFAKVHDAFGGHIETMPCGGAKLDPEVLSDFLTLGFNVLEGYGMTETAPMITFTRPQKNVMNSAGQPLPCMEVRIVDNEITVRGENVMKGYYKRPEETAEVIKDGWLHTGDLGYLDENDNLFVTGRKKEIIVLSNGKNINPEEVELHIARLSDIISEVGVYQKDDKLNAVVVPDLEFARVERLDNLHQYILDKVISTYNDAVSPVKRIIKITLINEELPRTRLGKLRRFQLAEVGENRIEKKKEEEEKVNLSNEYTIIAEYLSTMADRKVYPGDSLEIDLSLDSLDRVNLLVFLNNTFGMELTEEELTRYTTINDMAEDIKERKTKISVEAVDWGEILKQELDIDLPKSWFTYTIFKYMAYITLSLYFRIKGEGKDQLPDGPYILAPNHQSFFDGLFVISYLKNFDLKRTYFYAKEKHVRNKLVRFIADRHNVIVMDLNKDLKESIQKLAKALQNGKNVMIFPEGTRSTDGTLGDYKKTFAILARELNVPVVPVAISGAHKALPKGSLLPRPWTKIRVKFLDPVYPNGDTYETLTSKVKEQVAKYV